MELLLLPALLLGILLCFNVGAADAGTNSGEEAKWPSKPIPDNLDWANPGMLEGRALFEALKQGRIDKLEEWLANGFEINGLYEWETLRMPPISLALKAGNIDAVRFLLKENAEVDLLSEAGITDWEALGTIKYDATDPDERRDVLEQYTEFIEVFSPLMYASIYDSAEGAALLLENGADVDSGGAGGATPLMAAAAHKAVEVVKILLAASASTDDQLGDKDTLKELEVKGRRLVDFGAPQATALWIAAYKGHGDIVKLLLKADADADIEAYCKDVKEAFPGDEYCSASRIAELKEFGELAALFQGEGLEDTPSASGEGSEIEVVMRTKQQRVELRRKILAVMEADNVEKMKAYLEGGLDIEDSLVEEGSTTLLAMAAGKNAPGIVALLIGEGADVNKMTMKAPPTKGRRLVKKKKDDVPTVPLHSPLMEAVKNGCDECVTLLLEAEAEVNAAGYQGYTPLICATLRSEDDSDKHALARQLIKAGAEVDATLEIRPGQKAFPPRVDGATAFWMAAWAGDNKLLKIFNKAGADTDIEASCLTVPRAGPEEQACSARRIAELQGNENTVALLDRMYQAGAEFDEPLEEKPPTLLDEYMRKADFHFQLREVVLKEDVKTLKTLLDDGLDANTMIQAEGTVPLLSLAALNKRRKALRLLLEYGADPNLMSRNIEAGPIVNTGLVSNYELKPRYTEEEEDFPVFTPLMYAALSGDFACASALVKAGADVNARGAAGADALKVAAGCNHGGIVKMLIDAGADIEARTQKSERFYYLGGEGATALFAAAYAGSKSAAAFLLQAGADPSLKVDCPVEDLEGQEKECTARQLAERKGHTQVVSVIDTFLEKRKEKEENPGVSP